MIKQEHLYLEEQDVYATVVGKVQEVHGNHFGIATVAV